MQSGGAKSAVRAHSLFVHVLYGTPTTTRQAGRPAADTTSSGLGLAPCAMVDSSAMQLFQCSTSGDNTGSRWRRTTYVVTYVLIPESSKIKNSNAGAARTHNKALLSFLPRLGSLCHGRQHLARVVVLPTLCTHACSTRTVPCSARASCRRLGASSLAGVAASPITLCIYAGEIDDFDKK
jgi:hypothetical protein